MAVSRRAVATLGVLAGNFLAAIEATIVATAMPTVVDHLGGLAHYSWAFSAYMLTSTVTVPVWGKLSDLHGRRPYYLSAIAIFLAGSALAGAAQSMEQLIVFRALQGIGAGGLIPIGMTILGDLYTLRERARMQGVFSSVWGIASILGPLAGGYITQTMSWRWVFYLNLPFGLVAGSMVWTSLEDPVRHEQARIDYRGAAILTSGLTLLLLALTQTGAPDRSLSIPQLWGLYLAALALGYWFIRTERGTPEPILPLDLFTNRLIATVTACGFLMGVSMFGAITFVPLFVQSALGGTATQAGRALTPLLLGWVLTSIAVGRLLPHVGVRPLLVGGLSLVTGGFFGLSRVGHESGAWVLYSLLTTMGLGMGLTMLTLLLALQSAVPRERLGVVTSLGRFTPSIGGAVGVALMGAIIAGSVDQAGSPAPMAMMAALHRAFLAAAVAASAALVAAWFVPGGRPLGDHHRAGDDRAADPLAVARQHHEA
jgi:EmrB/QacA subfamily drug resistance transporter